MGETLFEELKRYVGWGEPDEAALRKLHAVAAPAFPAIARTFYDAILNHAEARRALTGGEQQVGHLKVTLQAWLDRLLRGPWDEEYFEARCRIGRYHVRIHLPQHYMFGAMNVVRRELQLVVHSSVGGGPEAVAATRAAVGRILDLELAIMLHTYREDLLAQQSRAERLATYGQLVGSIGHDLRNPLSVIETSVYLLRSKAGDDERMTRQLDRIGDQLGVANGIITNLLDLIRDRPLARAQVSLAELVAAAAGAVAWPPTVRFQAEGLEGLVTEGDPGMLRQVLVNLLTNAVQAVAPEGEVVARGWRDGGAVSLAIEDTGPGVDPSTAQRLFEPLITTKERGTGLGLALVKRIVERHGGTVGYAARPQGGACFTVRLPGLEGT